MAALASATLASARARPSASPVGGAGDRVLDAVSEVVLDEADRDALERALDRGDLGQDVDAVDVLVDHPLESADLALDPPQPLEVVGLVVVVAGCGVSMPASLHTPRGYFKRASCAQSRPCT